MSLATELGYASESVFSTAFKREVGESPLRCRHRMPPRSVFFVAIARVGVRG
ncbi:AraC family transcriptional regulator, partial [Nonomuraea turkmeniaca]|uniref:AraC family transcriptional regulator n=1 Tax=Nonomuraea turkmeniaca TaxID=103838 RepID=UPI001B8792EE